MSSSNHVSAPEQLCYIPCNLCNIILAVNVPCNSLFETVTVRCGQCTNLCSINLATSFQSRAGKDIQAPNYTSSEYRIGLSSSSRGKTKLSKRPITSTTQERVVNRPPEKRHRAPSLYNQFIKEEIQRIKLNNPDISHREAEKMAHLFLGVPQSSLVHLHLHPKLGPFPRQRLFNNSGHPKFAAPSNRQLRFKGLTLAGAVSSDSEAPTVVTSTVGSEKGGIGIEVDTGNGGGDKFDDRSGGGGGGRGGGDDSGSKGEGELPDDSGERKMALSMSQKLTLGYAALVGVGGAMGYMKSGSQKSLAAGGLSAAVLYYVYTQLPTNPVFASSIGLGISAALLGVMGSRFKRSGKVFPAGVVSLVSLVMTGGYLHGIMRSMH